LAEVKDEQQRRADSEVSELPRTTAMGLLTDAKEMLAAADILRGSGVWKVSGPTYYLLGHGIEVALKSFLLANGDSLDLLKHKLGHNLAKAARRVVATKCEPLACLLKARMPEIELLNIYYEAKEFEYRVTGAKRYPQKEVLIDFLREIIQTIEPVAFQAYVDRRA
jgi:hypothetical protein